MYINASPLFSGVGSSEITQSIPGVKDPVLLPELEIIKEDEGPVITPARETVTFPAVGVTPFTEVTN